MVMPSQPNIQKRVPQQVQSGALNKRSDCLPTSAQPGVAGARVGRDKVSKGHSITQCVKRQTEHFLTWPLASLTC